MSERGRLKFTYTHKTCLKILGIKKGIRERGKTIFSIEIRDLFCPSFLNPAFSESLSYNKSFFLTPSSFFLMCVFLSQSTYVVANAFAHRSISPFDIERVGGWF